MLCCGHHHRVSPGSQARNSIVTQVVGLCDGTSCPHTCAAKWNEANHSHESADKRLLALVEHYS